MAKKPKTDAPVTAEPEIPLVEPGAASNDFHGLGQGKVVHVSLSEIDLADKTFMFRVNLRTVDLEKSLDADGQQIPVVLRARRQGQRKYQLISGFRRCTAAAKLGWKTVAAIIRDDLTDEDAFRASVLENTARKTYSDLDRAYVLHAHRSAGYRQVDVAKMMGLSERQERNLEGLLKLPEEVQAAIDDPNQVFKATHALVLRRASGGAENFGWAEWIKRVNDENLSVSALKLRLGRELAKNKPEQSKAPSIFRNSGTDLEGGVIRFSPIKVNISDLSGDDKNQLRDELERVLKLLS